MTRQLNQNRNAAEIWQTVQHKSQLNILLAKGNPCSNPTSSAGRHESVIAEKRLGTNGLAITYLLEYPGRQRHTQLLV